MLTATGQRVPSQRIPSQKVLSQKVPSQRVLRSGLTSEKTHLNVSFLIRVQSLRIGLNIFIHSESGGNELGHACGMLLATVLRHTITLISISFCARVHSSVRQ